MLFKSWLSSFKQPRRRPIRKATPRRTRLSVELLEDRVVPTLMVQFDASTLALANNTVVSSWGGQTASGTPTYLTGQTPNGSAAVQFNAGGDRMGNNITLSPSAAGDWIVAAVVKANSIGAYHNLVDDEVSNRPMLWIDPSFRYEMNFGGGVGARGVGTGTSGWDIVIADSRLNQLYVNSATPNATGGGAVPFTAAETFDFFHRDGGQTYQGLVAELRVYNDRADFGGDFAALRASLAAKWFGPLNQPPTITSNGGGATASVSVAENITAVTTVTATDPDLPAQTLTYSISGADAAKFSIGNSSGVLTFNPAPDFENPTDVGPNNVYDVTVQVSDGNGGTDTQAISVTVTNVTAVISGTVFVDVDGDGLFDGGTETGINGVTVELLNGTGGFLANNVTELGGVYAFIVNDEFGTYRIREIQPTGVTNGAAILGTAATDSVLSANEMQLTLAAVNAADYDFTEVGGAVLAGDTASIGFWQNKHGQALITLGGPALVNWLNTNFGRIFGNTFNVGTSGSNDAAEVASFYKNEFFLKKLHGTSKVDAQFMATALATFFTSSTLSGGSVAASYGFNVTATGIGTRVVNVGSSGVAFGVANNTNMTIMALLQATNSQTGPNTTPSGGYSNVYDTNGDGVVDAAESALRAQANTIYTALNGG